MSSAYPAAVIVRHRVLWGDCDPAGVVYTPRFSDYVVLARDGFMRDVLGCCEASDASEGLSFPLRALAFDFRAPLRPDDRLEMHVRVERVGRSSFTLEVDGRCAARTAFTATCTTVCVEALQRRPVRLPQPVTALLTPLLRNEEEKDGHQLL